MDTTSKAKSSTEAVATPAALDRILSHPSSRDHQLLRDRMAYMYLTGTYPSHLRVFFTNVLTLIMQMHTKPSNPGAMHLDENIVEQLTLNKHRMVVRVREYVLKGWRIRVSRGLEYRKPYSRIFMYRGDERVTVHIDGKVTEGWK